MAAKYLAVPSFFQGAVQNVTTSATSAVSSAFGSETQQILLVTSAAGCFVLIGNGAITASTSNGTYLPPNYPVPFKVNPGQVVAAVTTSAGTLNVTELT